MKCFSSLFPGNILSDLEFLVCSVHHLSGGTWLVRGESRAQIWFRLAKDKG